MTSKHSFTPDEDIIIDQQLQALLNAQKIIYKAACQNQNSKENINNLDCYLVSTTFIEEWKQFTNYNSEDLNLSHQGKEVKAPCKMNQNIINEVLDFEQVTLAPHIQQQDYEVFSEEIKPAFQRYEGQFIHRKYYLDGDQKKLQMHPKTFRIFFVDWGQIQIARSDKNYQSKTYSCVMYKSETVADILQRFIGYAKTLNKFQDCTDGKIWLCKQQFQFDGYFENFRTLKNNTAFQPPGIEIDLKTKSEQFNVEGRIIAVEVMNKSKYVYSKAAEDKIPVTPKIKSPIAVAVAVATQPTPPVIPASPSQDFTKKQPYPYYAAGPALPSYPYENNKYDYDSDNFNNKSHVAPGIAGHKNNKNRCQCCRSQFKILKCECVCKKVQYCSQQCKNKDYKFHARTCDQIFKLENKNVKEILKFQVGPESKKGVVGLQNLGNTCYMNSALQCLSHTAELTSYFLKNYYQKEINQNNPISSQGKIAYSYAKFLQAMWCGQSKIFSPVNLKKAISMMQPMFGGYEQHDSQQFLSCLLDFLHQDLNRISIKPMTEEIQMKGKEEHIVARESWINYLKRNQSIITDLMVGQLKSLVTCPNCNYLSHTFDSFMTLPVPVPQDQILQITLFFFFHNFNQNTLKYTIFCKENTIQELQDHICRLAKVQKQNIKLFVTGFNGMLKEIKPTDTVRKLLQQKNLSERTSQRQLFCQQFSQQQMKEPNKHFLIFKFTDKSGKAFTFKRIFPFVVDQELAGSHLYDRLCHFMAKVLEIDGSNDKADIHKNYLAMRKNNKTFKIFMKWGNMKVEGQKVDFKQMEELSEEHKIGHRIIINDFQVEFDVVFQKETKVFNSFVTHKEPDAQKSNKISTYNLDDCFKYFTMSQILMDGNQWYCPRCKTFQAAQKQLQIYKAPKVLIIQLKRFRHSGKSKNQSIVLFPQQLDMQKYLLDRKLPQAYFPTIEEPFIKPPFWETDQPDTKQNTIYELYGMINHFGGIHGGHYISHALNNKIWYKFNDSSVSQVSNTDNIKESAYILFYRRKQ